jgi:hypothetical protein
MVPSLPVLFRVVFFCYSFLSFSIVISPVGGPQTGQATIDTSEEPQNEIPPCVPV